MAACYHNKINMLSYYVRFCIILSCIIIVHYICGWIKKKRDKKGCKVCRVLFIVFCSSNDTMHVFWRWEEVIFSPICYCIYLHWWMQFTRYTGHKLTEDHGYHYSCTTNEQSCRRIEVEEDTLVEIFYKQFRRQARVYIRGW